MSEAGDILGVVVTRVPLLITRIGSSFLRLLFGSRRAASKFRRTLRKNGVGRVRAGQLARRYRRQVDILRIVRGVIRQRPWEESRGQPRDRGSPLRLQ